MNKCENCEEEHNGEYGSGRFCSNKCARSFSTKENRSLINEKVSLKLQNRKVNKIDGKYYYEYLCQKCIRPFLKNCIIKKDRKIHCDECKRNVIHSNPTPITIFDLSRRTITKLLKRANIKCMMCGWDKTSLDIHHIIHKKDNGTDDNSNLICLCPNCHRMAHENKYTTEELLNNNMQKLFNNWKDYYNN